MISRANNRTTREYNASVTRTLNGNEKKSDNLKMSGSLDVRHAT